MTRALVTGASGFIGSALCRKLIASGIEVHAASRSPPVNAPHIEEDGGHVAGATMIWWWKADLVDLEAARGLIRDIRPDATFHLASSCYRFAQSRNGPANF